MRKKAVIQSLIVKAQMESGEISFPEHVNNVEECVTKIEDALMLWYNDSAGNTKVVTMKVR